MNNIENTYVNYDKLMSIIGEDVIESRIEQISQEILDFLDTNDLNEVAYINTMALTHAIMDYFSDIQRLKDYQEIEHINEVKIKAYETYWLLKRKPIQLKEQIDDDRNLYVNEKFLLSRLASLISYILSTKIPFIFNFICTFFY